MENNSVNNLFDGVFLINLPRRPDRLEHATKQLNNQNINFEVIEGIDGSKLWDVNKQLHKGIYGCSLSHFRCVKQARLRGLKNILIFEDDVVLNNNFTKIINENYDKIPKDYEFLYFGGNHLGGLIKLTDYIYKLRYSYALQAYVVNSNMYDFILSHVSTLQVPTDVLYAQFHSRGKSYLIRDIDKQLSWQLANHSDVDNCYADYDKILKT